MIPSSCPSMYWLLSLVHISVFVAMNCFDGPRYLYMEIYWLDPCGMKSPLYIRYCKCSLQPQAHPHSQDLFACRTSRVMKNPNVSLSSKCFLVRGENTNVKGLQSVACMGRDDKYIQTHFHCLHNNLHYNVKIVSINYQ